MSFFILLTVPLFSGMSINQSSDQIKNSKLNNTVNYMSFFILLTPFVFRYVH